MSAEHKAGGIVVFVCGAAMVGLLGWLAVEDKLPEPPDRNQLAGCTLLTSIKTDELRYCGKACWLNLYVNTYQCPTGTRVLIR